MLFKWDRNIKPPSHQASPNKWPTDSPQKRRASSVPQLVKYEERGPNHCPKAVATDIQEIWGFPVNFPLNQSIETWNHMKPMPMQNLDRWLQAERP